MTLDLAVTDFGGDGRPLLVLGPSIGTSVANLWGAVASRLESSFHVVGWDLPGTGRSKPAAGFTVPDISAAVLEIVGDEPFHYAGVSLGGAVGQQLLLDAPVRVVRASLFSTAPRIGTPDMWHERAARVRAEGMAFLVEASQQRWFAPANGTSDSAQALLADLAGVDVESYASACDALALFDVRDRLAEIVAPVLAVAGAHDQITTVAHLRHLAEGAQHGRLAVIDDASHQSPAEQPDVVAALLAGPAGAPQTTIAQVRAEGMRVRREVLGDAYVDRAAANADELTGEFQEFLTRYAWGSVWTRPGLDRRSRSLITITALVARGHYDELALHLRGALRNGVTKDEIKELLLQTAIYCGVPDANAAFRIAQQVFADT